MPEAVPRSLKKGLDISRDLKDLDDPANAPYLYEGPDGDRFIDWNNPGHKLERWVEINALVSGDPDRIMACYRDEYCHRLMDKRRLGPDYSDSGMDLA